VTELATVLRTRNARLEGVVESLLELLGLDVEENPHLAGTPRRVAQMFRELTTPLEFNFTTFENKDIDNMIVIKDMPFYSLCAHHMLPFFGKAHVAYIPDGKLAGLSKFARTLKHFTRGLNVQEEMTQDIMNFLVEHLDPKGVAVVVEGTHLCMAMRGIESSGHLTTTSAMYGVFLNPKKGARSEFLSLINGQH
jgi:GTP cyclohydrolase I